MLTLVPTPIGNIADISLRAMDKLAHADILLCEDTRVTKKLLHILSERYNLQRKEQEFISLHSHNEKAFIQKVSKEFFDADVVYVSDAGMPGISDPGQLLVRYCQDNAVQYDILPGANALLTAFVASGFVNTQMLFFGFLPHKGKDRSKGLQGALHNGFTTVLYEAPHRLDKLMKELAEEVPNRRVFFAKELTKKYQSFFHGPAKDILKQIPKDTIKGEWVVVVEAGAARQSTISEKDVLSLDMSKKTASKLISKITGENIKECYTRLTQDD
ncbi:MAG TPA: 16S rRNA (cytidine(1402)-2'-O)-methyltransferase [Sulfurimonas sp.]|nr:16S rRNA (cytidine(1402)-2'-O)-methyltransferase [Sulfurimonas sp.]